MTSFISKTFGYVAHQPQTVTAVLATARPLMNSSIVPVTLSDDEVWDLLCGLHHYPQKHVLQKLLSLFSTFSDTMQFTEKLRFHYDRSWRDPLDVSFLEKMLQDLVENKKYFSRTVKSITNFPSMKSIEICAGKLSNLDSIGIQPDRLTDSDMILICSKFNRITQLDFRARLHFITDEGFSQISKLRFLEHLNLSSQIFLEDLCFLKDLPRLSSLNLDRCPQLTQENVFGHVDDEDGNSSTEPPRGPVTLPPSLRSISFVGIRISNFHTFQRLQQIAPNLTSLSCSYLERGAGEAIGKMEYLRRLNISENFTLQRSDQLFETLSTKLQFLESLHFDAILNCDSCLEILSKSTAPLKRLRFAHHCKDFSDIGFRSLAAFRDLEDLEIEHQSGFTCEVGENIPSGLFPSLKRLNLTYCLRVNNEGIQSTLRPISLTSLVLRECPRITDEGLQTAFGNSNTQLTLEKLSLDELDGLESLNCLKTLKSLKELSLWRNPNLRTRALVKVILTLERLELFTVSGENFKAAAIQRSVENLRWLKRLVVDMRAEQQLQLHPKLVFLLSMRYVDYDERNVGDDESSDWEEEEAADHN